MSLVNQMLQDLEQRRAQLPRGDSLRGLHASPAPAATANNLWPTVLIGAAIAGVGYGWWLTFAEPAAQVPVITAPVATFVTPAPQQPVHSVAATPSAQQVDAQHIDAQRVDAEWDNTWEPRLAEAVAEAASVAALEESLAEPVSIAAETAPSAPIKPAPRPDTKPVSTATVITRATPPRGTPSMQKTPHAPSPVEQAKREYADALNALRHGEAARAEQHLRAALQQQPAHTQAAEALTATLLQQGRAAEAQEVLAEALTAAPNATQLLSLQARVLAEAGRDNEAVALLQSAALNHDADAQALLGALQQRLGNHTLAATAYRQALARAPQRGAWWLGLAISLEGSQDPTAALAAYRRALADTSLDANVSGYVRSRIQALDNG